MVRAANCLRACALWNAHACFCPAGMRAMMQCSVEHPLDSKKQKGNPGPLVACSLKRGIRFQCTNKPPDAHPRHGGTLSLSKLIIFHFIINRVKCLSLEGENGV